MTTAMNRLYRFTVADFRFLDIDFDSLASVKITSLETAGNLINDGLQVVRNQVIPRADITAGKLTFTPVIGESGVGHASFQFTVNDGTVDSALSYTMTVDVTSGTPVFDEGSSATRSLNETLGDSEESAPRDVGTAVTATDPQMDTLTYSLEGDDASKFNIDPSTGQIRTKANERYDHETDASLMVRVKVENSTLSATIDVTIELLDRVEPPLAPEAPVVAPTVDSSTSLEVSWSTPPNAGRPTIAAYDLSYRERGTGPWHDGPQGVTGTDVSLGGLVADTEYETRVRARNDEGIGSYSAPTMGRTNPPPVPTLSFERAAYTAVEGAGAAAVTVLIEPASLIEVTVRLRVTEGDGATASDYSGVPEYLTFAAGETTQTFEVIAVEDAALDDGESLLIEFDSLPVGVRVGSPASTKVMLVATQVTVWYLSFEASTYTADEGGAWRAGQGAS